MKFFFPSGGGGGRRGCDRSSFVGAQRSVPMWQPEFVLVLALSASGSRVSAQVAPGQNSAAHHTLFLRLVVVVLRALVPPRFVSPRFRHHANNTSISKKPEILCASVASGRWPASSRLCVPIDDALKQTRLCLVLLCAGPKDQIGEKSELRSQRSAKIEGSNILSLWAVLSLCDRNGTPPSSVHPSPQQKRNIPGGGNPTNVVVGELGTGISYSRTDPSFVEKMVMKSHPPSTSSSTPSSP